MPKLISFVLVSFGKATITGGGRVNWQTICHSKVKGGLGVKDMLNWNQACIIENIWSITSKVGSIWIVWIQEYVLKGREEYLAWNNNTE